MEIRSGRFKKKGLKSTPHVVIVSQKEKAIYRFFNSGSVKYYISQPNGVNKVELEPTHSVDIALDGILEISADNDTNEIEGIYDIVSQDRTIRSGRFKILATSTPSKVDILHLKTADLAYYRFYNSGDPVNNASFAIKGLKLSSGAKDPVLEPGMTIDVAVEKAKTVSIEGTNANVEIEGIYEYLGN